MKKILILAALLFNISTLTAQINIDENFADWLALEPLYTDQSTTSADIDFNRLWLSDDENFLYYCFDTGDEINLQEMNDITLYLDVDNNASTGRNVNGIGAEIVYNFGDRSGTAYLQSGNVSLEHPDLFLITAPTVTSDIFEGLIKKDLPALGLNLSESDTIAVVLKNGNTSEMIPATGEILKYVMTNSSSEYFSDYSINKKDPDDLRFMSYNVEFDGIMNSSKQPYFKRIITTLDPDIITFQEIYDSGAETIASLVAGFFDDGRSYYSAKRGPDNIIVSKYPVTASTPIPATSGYHGNGAFVVDMTEKYGTHALVISAHTPCCANNEDRQDEIDAIMALVRNAKDGTGPVTIDENSPVFIAGDMNLVGFKRQLETFLTGDIFNNSAYGPDFVPDWDDSDFEDAKPGVPNLPLYFTWYDEGSNYAPGRLDFIIYSGSVVEKVNSFSFYTRSFPADTLTAYGLDKDDAVRAADHNPPVADFRFPKPNSVEEETGSVQPGKLKLYQNFPNPFNPETNIRYSLGSSADVKLKIFAVTGEEIYKSDLGYREKGEHSVSVDLASLNSGVYFYTLTAGSSIQTKKLVLLK